MKNPIQEYFSKSIIYERLFDELSFFKKEIFDFLTLRSRGSSTSGPVAR